MPKPKNSSSDKIPKRGLPVICPMSPNANGPKMEENLLVMLTKPKNSPVRFGGIKSLRMEREIDWLPPCTNPTIMARI
ncbi:hypothetical protein D3C76_1494370 [compost metagenome]